MQERPLSGEMAERWGHLRHLRYKGRGEWSAECPECGESGHDPKSGPPDRFHIHSRDDRGPPRGICRKCGYADVIREDWPGSKPTRRPVTTEQPPEPPPPVVRLSPDSWKRYHANLNDRWRSAWRAAGIPDAEQDRLYLGYRMLSVGQYMADSLTIPYFGPSWSGPHTIQYRLLEPPPRTGKYRFERGLPATLYIPRPDVPIVGPTLIVEGAKKAIVCSMALSAYGYVVVGLPSKSAIRSAMANLNESSPIFIGLDPDANHDGTSERLAKELGAGRSRVVTFTDKPDDLLLAGLDVEDLLAFIENAKRI